jgi:exopolyphosphatase/pppGpp-phosphohydrolase
MRAAFDDDPRLAALALCLRLAVIFHRSRRSLPLPRLRLLHQGDEWRLEVDEAWLRDHTLVDVALEHEKEEWESVGLKLKVATTEAG